jgi:crotonobetainyl-CoA:carnitine CoA-transferase CaiB-like acyl-CoA transferase
VVRRLAARSDVLIENFRPGLMARFGLDLAALRAANPRLVTCSLTAFADDDAGQASRPGYDIIMQALTGLMSITGERDGEPTKVGVAVLDVIAGSTPRSASRQHWWSGSAPAAGATWTLHCSTPAWPRW